MTTTLSILMAAVLAGPADASGSQRADAARSAPSDQGQMTNTEWREVISTALRREATTDDAAHDDALRDLVAIYNELERDSRLPEAERLQRRGQIRFRLAAAADELERQAAGPKPKPRAARKTRPAARQPKVRSVSAGQQAIDAVLGQRAAPPAAVPPGQAPAPGFAQQGGGARGAGGVTEADQAQQLIDLIQTTIAPHTWDINGGPGTIMYFAPKHVLVVRQTAEVHGRLGGVVRQLRRN